ncbi:RAD51-associated protein 1 isoform X2 [Rhipicephalus sanguineus]|uniref:RAD51-associated protein 1 isoform X2 n=1 Tax=Rhipicephalus sanguineus TaxID=34632 RepID=UPI0020C370A5|nr:RAD51-associated protein 1 isoform X2 [Rhipicephalus sanguineus]
MAEGRRSSRAHKTVNYAKLDYGSEEDDDFKPSEAPPSKRPKPAVKEAPKKAEKKTKPDSGGDTSSSAVSQKQKTGRASLDDKLFQRDLEAALRLSQNGPASDGQCQRSGSEGKPADSIIDQKDIATFPLELAGEVVVQSEPATDIGKPSASPAAEVEQEEDYQPEQEESSEDEEDEEDASDEDYSGSDDDEEFSPSKAKASRSRKEPVEKKPPATLKKPAGK